MPFRRFSLRQTLFLNAGVITVCLVGLLVAAVYLYWRHDVLQAHERLISRQAHVREILSRSLDHAAHNLHALRNITQIFETDLPPAAQRAFYERGARDLLSTSEGQYNCYFAYEPRLSQTYFDRKAYILTTHKDFARRGTPDYSDPSTFVTEEWTDDTYQRDRQEVWYHAAKGSRNVAFSEIYFDETYMKVWMFTAALGVYRDGRFEGMVGIDLLLDSLYDPIEKAQIGDTGGVLLVRRSDHTVLTRLAGERLGLVSASERMSANLQKVLGRNNLSALPTNPEDIVRLTGQNGDDYIVSAADVDRLPWTLVAFQRSDELYAQALGEGLLLLAASLIALTLILAVLWTSATAVTAPLKSILEQGIDKIRRGHFDVQLDVPQGNELGTIARSLESLAQHLDETLVSRDRLQAEVAQRRQVEDELRRFKYAVDSASDAVGMSDLDGTHFYQNASFSQLFGYNGSEELAAAGGGPALYEDPAVAAEVFHAILAGDSWEGEVPMRSRHGRQMFVHLRAGPIHDPTGTLVAVVGVHTDITARKHAEAMLRQSEERHRVLFESSRDAIMTLAPPSWKFTSANPATLDMFSASDEAAFTALEPWEVSPDTQPDGQPSADKAKAMIETAVREGSHFFEWEHMRLNGERFPATVILTRMEIDNTMSVQATVRDITDEKRAREERERLLCDLQERAKELRGLYDVTKIASTEHDVAKILQQAVHCIPPSFQHSEITTARISLDGTSYTSSGFQQSPYSLRARLDVEGKKRGSIDVFYTEERPVRDEGPFLAQEHDLLRGMAQQLGNAIKREELARRVRRSEKMQAVGQLAGGIAHEFNNQLAIINGFAELAHRKLGDNRTLASMIDRIRKAGKHSAELTEQLLAYSRGQEAHPAPCNLNEIVRHMERMLAHLLGTHIRLHTDLAADLHDIVADADRISDVLMNLCTNARDAMPEGGELVIETANIELSAEDVTGFANAKAGRFVQLSVRDTGTGMDEAAAARIFEPFYTTKEVGDGTGLGLAMVYGAVEQSNGAIAVESEPGTGTTVKVWLPRSTVEA